MKSMGRRVADWVELWLQSLAFLASGYASLQYPEPQLDLNQQLDEILMCVRQQELKWRITTRHPGAA
jgi:hypothetical protein